MAESPLPVEPITDNRFLQTVPWASNNSTTNPKDFAMNANDLFNAVTQLDLEPIKMKLMHVASGEGWSQEKANAVEKEYRRFLCLMKMYPDEDTAPQVDVDTFWHYHILDTMKYAVDCEQVFGYFLHHYPYVGMRGEEDDQFRLDSGDRMRELYEATFGEPYPGGAALAGDAGTAYCAGPHADTAYCAGPHAETAYCAGPHVEAAADTAWCAGPRREAGTQRPDGAAGTAWCAGPRVEALAQRHAEGAATAWCAGPRREAQAKDGAATAWCAGPRREAQAKEGAATAWCAGPRRKAQAKDGAATAWCAGPRREAQTKDGAATAWCAGPRREAQARAAG
jgi:hypothetical protein